MNRVEKKVEYQLFQSRYLGANTRYGLKLLTNYYFVALLLMVTVQRVTVLIHSIRSICIHVISYVR
jgi:hypothetical protein